MLIVTIVCLTFLMVLAHISRQPLLVRRLFNIFNIWWIIVLVFSKIQPYGGYIVSEDTYLLFFLFLLVFGISFVLARNIDYGFQYEEAEIQNQYTIYIEENRELFILLMFCTVMLGYYAYRYSTIMTMDTFLNARNERFYVGGLFKSTIEILFYNFFVTMWKYFFAFVISFSIAFSRMKSKFFVFSVIDLILYTYIGSSRFPIVLLVINLIVIFIIKKTYGHEKITFASIRRFAFLILTMFIAVFLMAYITAFRRGVLTFNLSSISENFSILYDQMIGYSTGPISGLSYLQTSKLLYNHWFFGRAVLINGVEELLVNFAGFAGIPLSCAKYVLAEVANKNIIVGSETFNALYSCVYWFFADFGYIGVVIFSAIFGWVEKKCVSFYSNRPSLISLMLIVHVMYFMIASNMIWQINNVDSLLYIGLIYIIERKMKKEGGKC